MSKYWHSLLADIKYTISESFQNKRNLCNLQFNIDRLLTILYEIVIKAMRLWQAFRY